MRCKLEICCNSLQRNDKPRNKGLFVCLFVCLFVDLFEALFAECIKQTIDVLSSCEREEGSHSRDVLDWRSTTQAGTWPGKQLCF